ncbi:hypothetical protein BC629DRAFT_1539541 [Irpex lacteus]|nr:hypothetical protein BC629DRAFT_1539541 [Irpex lacteus]
MKLHRVVLIRFVIVHSNSSSEPSYFEYSTISLKSQYFSGSVCVSNLQVKYTVSSSGSKSSPVHRASINQSLSRSNALNPSSKDHVRGRTGSVRGVWLKCRLIPENKVVARPLDNG